eukprot:1929445-Alexandrium_andersonii.AAC.1
MAPLKTGLIMARERSGSFLAARNVAATSGTPTPEKDALEPFTSCKVRANKFSCTNRATTRHGPYT